MTRMLRARRSRTFAEVARARERVRAVAGQLFVRASERAERVYLAMCARGWRTERCLRCMISATAIQTGTKRCTACPSRWWPGERVALIGPNGAGKSTLLLHLNGLCRTARRPTPAVTVDGLPVAGRTCLKSAGGWGCCSRIRTTSSSARRYGRTSRSDRASLGCASRSCRGASRRSLAKVGLAGFEQRLPHHLSRGEKRRACLAGLLACECQRAGAR